MKRVILNIYFLIGILTFSISQNFESHVVDSTIIGPAGICATDMNNDGFLDVIAAGWDGHTIELYTNSGLWPLSWSHKNVATDFGGASYVATGDIDTDGMPDIIGSAFYDDELAWWKLEGSDWMKYPVATGFLQAHEVMAYDVDQDGDLDVLGAAAESNEISWFENTGDYSGEWPKHIVDDQCNGARSVDAADIDGDGDIDLAGAALSDHEVIWYRNDGGTPIQYTKITINSSFTYSHKVQIIDMNNDGYLDILGTAYQNGIKWWESNGEDSISWTIHSVSSFSTAVIAKGVDIDNDGDIDILATSQGTGRVARWINNGENSMTWNYQVIEIFSGAWPLDCGDMDNDGDMDFVVGGNTANQVRWYEGDFIMNETVTDFDGNEYQTVQIGNQTWLKQNLKSLHYADGSEITEVWSYDDDETNVDIYGRLYTWNAAMKYSNIESTQGVCPDGWHIPSDGEWTTLGNYLGGDAVAGGKMKTTGTDLWQAPNTGGTNESGFSAVPSGERDHVEYRLLGQCAVIWSSTETGNLGCLYRYINYDDTELHSYNFYKDFRYSVRCVKDETVGINEEVEKEQKGLIIQPNPAKDFVLINSDLFDEFEEVEVRIYAENGQVLQSCKTDLSNGNKINISNLPKGVYFVQVASGEKVSSNMFIKK